MIEEAIAFALKAHSGVKRKGKDRPYILHPIEAMTIVAGMTDDEAVIAAAVLHDTIEDTTVTEEELNEAFGARTAAIVVAESENKRPGVPAEKTWQVRKQETIDHLSGADRDAKLVCLGDKLSNLREIGRDYALLGDELWNRFNQKDKKMLGWYYRSVFNELKKEFGETPEIKEFETLLKNVFG